MSASASGENRLGKELSPYLKQHKNNPVDWYPWGQEAIQRAKDENKMVFLSIGYSTCHWCHVMERESFENEAVAAVMNQNYVNIKVDREERPDVDKVYMTFVQATTGGGGWPLSLWLSPDLKPVFGGTYFPPSGSFGRPGFTQILQALAGQWEENNDDMKEAGAEVINVLARRKGLGQSGSGSVAPPDVCQKLFAQLSNKYDPQFGGFSGAPKFPQPSNLMVLFRLQSWSEESQHRKKVGLEMNLHTLDMMDKGGIHDHISKGFARYSTDKEWHVPHFEKMLYDQAQLTMAYTEAATITGDKKYADVVDDILTYVSRDLTHALGGFFSAEDADSLPAADSQHKKEGAFCVWTMEEVKQLLGASVEGTDKTLADVVIHHYNMKEGGNVDPSGDPHGELRGMNVLTELPVKDKILPEAEYNTALDKAKKMMFDERLKRPRPGLDDKIIAAWNGLMISAFCRAGAALARPDYTDVATRAGDFIRSHMYDEKTGTLLRSVYGGKEQLQQLEAPISGFIDDYCFIVQAMLDLYHTTLDAKWLETAFRLQETQDKLFLDDQEGGYFQSEAGAEDIVLRLKDDQDGAEPSSNSVAAMNLLRLARILEDGELEKRGLKIFSSFSEYLKKFPIAVPAMADALLFHAQRQPVVVFTGPPAANDLLRECRAKHLPSHVFVGANSEDGLLNQRLKVLAEIPDGEENTAYVIREGKLSQALRTMEDLEKCLT